MSEPKEEQSLDKLSEADGSKESSDQSFLHPLSGLAILLIDNAFFIGEIASLGLSLPLTCILAFLSATAGVALIQKLVAGNEWKPAIAKAVLGGIAAGVPFPVAGTLAGGIIMAVSGLKGGKKTEKS
jgi:hypothetical protein